MEKHKDNRALGGDCDDFHAEDMRMIIVIRMIIIMMMMMMMMMMIKMMMMMMMMMMKMMMAGQDIRGPGQGVKISEHQRPGECARVSGCDQADPLRDQLCHRLWRGQGDL